MDVLTYIGAACLLGLILCAFEGVIKIQKLIKKERDERR